MLALYHECRSLIGCATIYSIAVVNRIAAATLSFQSICEEDAHVDKVLTNYYSLSISMPFLRPRPQT